MDKLTPRNKPHEVDSIIITCMDHRYQEPIKRILKDRHNIDIDHTDRLAIGGASKGVIDGTLMPSLQIAYEKHSTRNVYILDHIDCGGFGGLANFDNDEQKEAKAHYNSLDEARDILNKAFKDLVVVTYVVGLDGEPLER